jgi:hypothetical protein
MPPQKPRSLMGKTYPEHLSEVLSKTLCTCGCYAVVHRGGSGECLAPDCACDSFTLKQKQHATPSQAARAPNATRPRR